mmetsp:Transcript_91318/g.221740  ORF Transcript_91318/g.221740 Transcript_91318/m.221740 type:complete len:259 (-) Transcript_91318:724-1500(-)
MPSQAQNRHTDLPLQRSAPIIRVRAAWCEEAEENCQTGTRAAGLSGRKTSSAPLPSKLRDLSRCTAQGLDGASDHLGHDLSSRLDVVNGAGGLADQQRLHLGDHHLLALLLALLHVVVHRQDALGGQLLDLAGAVLLPAHDVVVLDDPHRPASEDDGPDGVMVSRRHGALLVARRSPGLLRGHEAGANPDSAGTHAQRHCQAAAVEDAAGGHDEDGAAGELGGLAPAEVHDLRDQDGRGHFACVAAALAALRAAEQKE